MSIHVPGINFWLPVIPKKTEMEHVDPQNIINTCQKDICFAIENLHDLLRTCLHIVRKFEELCVHRVQICKIITRDADMK